MKSSKSKCFVCKMPCSSWWMFTAGLAKKDFPLCFECMEKLANNLVKNVAKAMFGKRK